MYETQKNIAFGINELQISHKFIKLIKLCIKFNALKNSIIKTNFNLNLSPDYVQTLIELV